MEQIHSIEKQNKTKNQTKKKKTTKQEEGLAINPILIESALMKCRQEQSDG